MNKSLPNILFFIIVTLTLRLFLSTLPSFEYDQNAYRAWSARLVELGPSQFYSSEFFTNNPLGGLYIFWLVGFLKTIFLPDLSFFSKDFDLLLKLPANIADIISGLIIYLFIKRKVNNRWAIAGYLLYVLNPALIFNSSIWGQYDGISTIFLLITTYAILIKKIPELSALTFAIAWTIKPQAIVFAPILILLILLTQKPIRWVTSTSVFLLALIILYLPFFPDNPILGLIYVNQNSAGLFNCTTCFAFNLWGIFGNWQNDLQRFFNIPLGIWGVILLLANLLPILFFKPFRLRFKPPYFYFTTAISIMAFFMFLTRMHERYLFPFFPFMLLATIMLRSKILIGFYISISGLHLLNLYLPYAYYNNLAKITNLPVNNLINNFGSLSFISFLSFILLFIYYLIYVKRNPIS